MLNEPHVPVPDSKSEPFPVALPDVAIHPHPTADDEPMLLDTPVLSDPDAVAVPIQPKSRHPEKSSREKESE